MKRELIAVLVGTCILCAGCSGTTLNSSVNSGDGDPKTTQTATPTFAPTPAPTPEKKEYTFGSTFEFDDVEITIGTAIEWTKVSNQFSDKNGKAVIKLPVTIKNVSDETHGLNMFYYKFYSPAGTKIETVSAYFKDDISSVGEMRSGAEKQAYIHILYEDDGDYYIEFNNYKDKLEVKLPIKK